MAGLQEAAQNRLLSGVEGPGAGVAQGQAVVGFVHHQQGLQVLMTPLPEGHQVGVIAPGRVGEGGVLQDHPAHLGGLQLVKQAGQVTGGPASHQGMDGDGVGLGGASGFYDQIDGVAQVILAVGDQVEGVVANPADVGRGFGGEGNGGAEGRHGGDYNVGDLLNLGFCRER